MMLLTVIVFPSGLLTIVFLVVITFDDDQNGEKQKLLLSFGLVILVFLTVCRFAWGPFDYCCFVCAFFLPVPLLSATRFILAVSLPVLFCPLRVYCRRFSRRFLLTFAGALSSPITLLMVVLLTVADLAALF